MTAPPVGQPASDRPGSRESAQGAVGHRDRRGPRRGPDALRGPPGGCWRNGHVLQQHRHLRADQPERHLRRPPDLPRHAERLQDPPGPATEPSGGEAPVPARPHLHLLLPHPDGPALHRGDEHHDDEHQVVDRRQGGAGPHRRHRDRPGTPGAGSRGPFTGRRERRRRAVGDGRSRLLPAGSRIGPGPGPRRHRPALLREWRRSRPGRRGSGGGARGDPHTDQGDQGGRRREGDPVRGRVRRRLAPRHRRRDRRGGSNALARRGGPHTRNRQGVRRVPPGAAPGRSHPGQLRRHPDPHYAADRLRRLLDGDLPRAADHHPGAAAGGGDRRGGPWEPRRFAGLPVQRRVRHPRRLVQPDDGGPEGDEGEPGGDERLPHPDVRRTAPSDAVHRDDPRQHLDGGHRHRPPRPDRDDQQGGGTPPPDPQGRRRGTDVPRSAPGGALRGDPGPLPRGGRGGGRADRAPGGARRGGEADRLPGQPHRAARRRGGVHGAGRRVRRPLPGDAPPARPRVARGGPEDRARHPQSPDADPALHRADAAEIRRDARGGPRVRRVHAGDPFRGEHAEAPRRRVHALRADAGPAPRGGGSPGGDPHRRGHVPDVPSGDPLGVPPGRPAARLVRPVPDPARRHQPARQRRGRPRGAGERHGLVRPRRGGGEGADRRCGRRAGDPARGPRPPLRAVFFAPGGGHGIGARHRERDRERPRRHRADEGQHAAGHRVRDGVPRPAAGEGSIGSKASGIDDGRRGS